MKINGNTYKLIKENSKTMLWEATTIGGSVFWEVWLKRFTKVDYQFPGGAVIPAGSLIKPSNEHFGMTAWSLMTGDAAEAKFTSISEYVPPEDELM